MKKSWVIGLLIAWIVIIGVVAMVVFEDGGEEPIAPPEPLPAEEVVEEPVEEPMDTEERGKLTQGSCEAAGGSWDDCGSMCRGREADVCIELCATYCECETADQCPSGYTCGEFVDGVGICL